MEKDDLIRKRGWIDDFREDPRHSGLFLDFEGTISETDPLSGEPTLSGRAGPLLENLARSYPLCVMSGGRVADLARRVGLPHTQYVGVHGMEWMEEAPVPDPEVLPHLPTLEKARRRIAEALPDLEGVEMEDKMLILALDYGKAPELENEVTALVELLSGTLGLEVRSRPGVVELRPPVDIDKGTALIRLAAGWRLRRGLYAGDDITDVEGFRGLRRLMREGYFEGVAVAVLNPETPVELEAVADLTVDGVEGLLDLLEGLL